MVRPITRRCGRSHRFDVLRQAQQGQQLDAPVIEIHLPPGHTMAGRHGMRMVIVVPAIAAVQQRYPPAIR